MNAVLEGFLVASGLYVRKRDEDVGENREGGGRQADGNLGGTTPHGRDYTRAHSRRIASERPV